MENVGVVPYNINTDIVTATLELVIIIDSLSSITEQAIDVPA